MHILHTSLNRFIIKIQTELYIIEPHWMPVDVWPRGKNWIHLIPDVRGQITMLNFAESDVAELYSFADVAKLYSFADVDQTVFIRGCTKVNYTHLN